MRSAVRRTILAVVAAALLLALGASIAAVVPDVLATSAEPAARMRVEQGAAGFERDVAMAWLARALLVLAVAWVVIGMLSARTRLVRRPGAAAARAAWLAATRPWRARESTLGMLPLDRWLLIIIPGGLLVATRAVQTSFLSWTHMALVLGGWLVFLLVVRAFVRERSPWPVVAAVGGVLVLRSILTLIVLSIAGPGGYWLVLWADPVPRTVYITIAFALFVWLFVAAGWALSSQFGARRGTGIVLAGIGAGLAIPAAVIGLVGLDGFPTLWNDEMGLLLWGLARVLGLTTHADIPPAAPWIAAGVGVVVALLGVFLALTWRRDDPRR
jgi:hypothetical protein